MSQTIDNRVVQMEFENKNFEKNASKTIKTLDKLDEALKFKNGAKTFQDVEEAAAKVNFQPLLSAVDEVKDRFNILDKAVNWAVKNVVDSMMNMGKQMLKSLTIDPITTGYSKYEEKISSVQTLLNSTGLSLDEVNGYLNKLMTFSDETSYSFTNMTSALATMTSAGGDIETLVPMLEGIANATAFAGKGASAFSGAIYNLNQSYAGGFLNRTDFNSLDRTYNMFSKQLKQAFIDAGKAAGTLTEEGKTLGGTLVDIDNFADTLSEQWADRTVMENAFGYFAAMTEEAYDLVNSGVYDTYSEAYEAIADSYDDVQASAARSAQEAKTFTEAIDATKDAVSSGFMQTFELLIGDYEEAKVVWTDLANSLYDIFVAPGNTRNEVLTEALTSKWYQLNKQLTTVGVNQDTLRDKLLQTGKTLGVVTDEEIENLSSLEDVLKTDWMSGDIVADALRDYASVGAASVKSAEERLSEANNIVKEILRGEWGKGAERMQRLAEAGYDYAEVQGYVNTYLSKRVLTEEDLGEAAAESSDLTDEQREALEALAAEAEDSGSSFGSLIDQINEASGRDLILYGIQNILSNVTTILEEIQAAFQAVFGEIDAGQVLSVIQGFFDLSESLIISEDSAASLYNVFSGIASVIKTILDIAKGIATVIAPGFRLVKKLGGIALNLLGNIGSAVTQLLGGSFIENAFSKLATVADGAVSVLESAVDLVVRFFEAVKEVAPNLGILEKIQNFLSGDDNSGVFEKITTALANAKQALDDISTSDIVAWLQNLGKIVSKIQKKISEFWQKITKFFAPAFAKISNALSPVINYITGTAWPAIKSFFEELANSENPIATLFDKISELGTTIKSLLGFTSDVKEDQSLTEWSKETDSALGDVESSISNFVKNVQAELSKVDLTAIISVLAIAGIAALVVNLSKFLNGIGSMASSISDFVTTVKKKITPATPSFVTNLSKIAAALVSLGATIYALAQLELGQLASATGAVVVLAGVLIGVTLILNHISAKASAESMENLSQLTDTMSAVGKLVLMLAAAVLVLAKLDTGKMWLSVFAVAVLAGIIAGLGWALTKIANMSSDVADESEGALSNLQTLAEVINSIVSDALLPLIAAVAGLSILNQKKLWSSVGIVAVLALIVAGLAAGLTIIAVKASKFPTLVTTFAGLATAFLPIAKALLLLAGGIAVLSLFDTNKLWEATKIVGSIALGLVIIMALLALISSINVVQAASMAAMARVIVGVGAAVLILAVALAIIAGIKFESPKAVLTSLGILAGTMLLLVGAMFLIGKFVKPMAVAAGSILALAAAVLIVVLSVKFLSTMSFDGIQANLWAFIASIVSTAGLFALLAWATTFIKPTVKTIAGLAAALALVALSVLLMCVACKYLINTIKELKGDTSVLWPALISLAVICALVSGMLLAIGLAAKIAGTGTTGIIKFGVVLLLAAVAIGLLISSLKILMNVVSEADDPSSLWKALGIITAFAVLCSGIMIAAGFAAKLGGGAGIGYMIVTLALVVVLILAIYALQLVPADTIISICRGLAIAMVGLSILFIAIGGAAALAKGAIKGGAAIALAALSLVAVAAAVWIISKVPSEKLLSSAIVLGVAFAVLIGALAILTKITGVMGSALALLVLSGVLIVIAAALWIVAAIPVDSLTGAAIALVLIVVALGAVAGVLGSFGAVSLAGAGAIAILAGALLIIAAAIWVCAQAFNVFVAGLQTAQSLDFAGLASGIMAIVVPLLLLGVAGIIATVGAVGFLAAGIALLAVAAVFAIIASSAYTMASGLLYLKGAWDYLKTGSNESWEMATQMDQQAREVRDSSEDLQKQINDAKEGITDSIENQNESVAEATDDGTKAVEEATEAKTEAVEEQTEAVAEAVEEQEEAVVDAASDSGLGSKIGSWLSGMGEKYGVDLSGMDVEGLDAAAIQSNLESMGISVSADDMGALSGIFNGDFDVSSSDYQSYIDSFTKNATSAGTDGSAAVESMLTSAAESASSAGTDSGTAFVSNFASSLLSDTSSVEQAGEDLGNAAADAAEVDTSSSGEYFLQGVIKGMDSIRGDLLGYVQGIAKEALETLDLSWLVSSPSRETAWRGMHFVNGLIVGIKDNEKYAIYAVENLAGDTLDALNAAMDSEDVSDSILSPVLDMNDVLNQMNSFGESSEWNPTIHPTLDMSGVNPGLRNLNAIASYRSGTGTKAGASDATESGIGSGGVTFNQYNTSPKALSRLEIYRQTKNQISFIERVTRE